MSFLLCEGPMCILLSYDEEIRYYKVSVQREHNKHSMKCSM